MTPVATLGLGAGGVNKWNRSLKARITSRCNRGATAAYSSKMGPFWIVPVLVRYLDDSGKDPQNPITTLAGYVAKDMAWEGFEAEAKPIFESAA